MQKVWQQSQAGYHYESWKSHAIEDTKNKEKRQQNAGPNRRPLLRNCKPKYSRSEK